MAQPRHDRCEVCGKMKQVQSKACKKCFNHDKMPEDVRTWMQEYDLHRCQLKTDVVEHLRKCSPLGREIMLIVMRLERDQAFSERSRAARKARTAQRNAEREARKAAERERREAADRIRVEQAIARLQAKKEVKKAEPWKNYATWITEDSAKVSRMMRLAGGRL